MKTYIRGIQAVFVLLILWIILYLFIDHALIMPSPIDVLSGLINIISTPIWLKALASTLGRLIFILGIAALSGVVFGVYSGFHPKTSAFISPYITILRTIPVISIIVILLIILGYQLAPFAITWFMIFPIIYQASLEGVRHLDLELLDVYHLENNDFWLGIKLVYYPMLKKNIFLSFMQSFSLGIKVLIMAEYLAQTPNSMGNALYLARVNLNYDLVFAWTIILILIAFGLEYVIKKFSD